MTDLFLVKSLFWTSLAAVVYAYFGYPLALMVLKRVAGAKEGGVSVDASSEPTLSIIIPVHNEAAVIEEKLRNLLMLDYPAGKREIIIVSDGSTDQTGTIVERYLEQGIRYIKLPERRGKAAALNSGLAAAVNEIVVFTDASIMLRRDALRNIVRRFQDPAIGCISGEDHIPEGGGEGAYGKYELFLRNQESAVHSIVGASGSFYAQRRSLAMTFREGMAPDFLSVLDTVAQGYRAVTEPAAVGTMTSVKAARDEFDRKVRTLLRGMSALLQRGRLLNPFKYGVFAFELWSHKIMRWLVPFFLLGLFCANLLLVGTTLYSVFFALQAVFYLLAAAALLPVQDIKQMMMTKIPLYFITVNAAIVVAWVKYVRGVRQEIWNPSRRSR